MYGIRSQPGDSDSLGVVELHSGLLVSAGHFRQVALNLLPALARHGGFEL